MKIKGQNLRMGFKDENNVFKYIAGALTFDLSIEVDTEDSTTKDSTADFKEYEAVMKGWSGSGQCRLAKDAEDLTGIQGWDISDLVGKTLHAEFNETSGNKNRETVIKRKSGDIILTSWKITSANKETVNVDFAFQGTGELKNDSNNVTITGDSTIVVSEVAKTATYTASDSSKIYAQVADDSASWLDATIVNNVLTIVAKSSTSTMRVGHITLTTPTGGMLRIEAVQCEPSMIYGPTALRVSTEVSTESYESSDGSSITAEVDPASSSWLNASITSNGELEYYANDEATELRVGYINLTNASGGALRVNVVQDVEDEP